MKLLLNAKSKMDYLYESAKDLLLTTNLRSY